MPIFDQDNANINVTFSFPEFVSTRQKTVYSINSSLTYRQF